MCLITHFSKTRANLTSNLDRIKIVFTPMMCRRVCSGGRCYNSCEKGDMTEVYSETSPHQQPKNQVFCQIPCLNGGRCIGRDMCWCPSNSTGRFCHLPVPPPARPTPQSHRNHQKPKSPSHSMYTLPLSNQSVEKRMSLHPSLVNVHIQHPPEADVQIHQVARVQPGQRPATTEGAHSVQQRSQPGNGHEHASEHSSRHPHANGNGHGHATTHIRQNGNVGRCFQETVDGQCGKPLPGLTKQDDCCGSIGASWGLNKCQKCPTKPAYAVIANGQVECSKGFKRMNVTHCQDINECLLPGICKNAECLNTKGSYRCTCKPGYMLDPARSHCVSDKAVSDQRAPCYRSVSAATCSLPLTNHLTKQICCCSRVGKAWGAGCDRCPLPGSGTAPKAALYHFKEICPAGHGYTYSRSDVQISLRQLDDVELQSMGVSLEDESPTYPQFPFSQPSFPSGPQYPSYPETPQLPQYPEYSETPQAPQYPLTPQHPSHPARETPRPPHTDGKNTFYVDVNECATGNACPAGICINSAGSYTCQNCRPGFEPSADRLRCEDVDECSQGDLCLGGVCANTEGSYICTRCKAGYRVSQDQQRCEGKNSLQLFPAVLVIHSLSFPCKIDFPSKLHFLYVRNLYTDIHGVFFPDIDECQSLSTCVNGICLNSEGSYTCENCPTGYRVSFDGELCEDIDECQSPSACPTGVCANTEGSFSCMACDPGFELAFDRRSCEGTLKWAARCVFRSRCQNLGKFEVTHSDLQLVWICHAGDVCVCVNSDVNECEDARLCVGGQCTNAIGSYSCSCPSGMELVDGTFYINECLTAGGICGEGDCLNTEGSYLCICPNGYTTTDGSPGCQDIDECDNETICGSNGFCENTDGSFRCQCDRGYTNPPGDMTRCVDVNECEMSLALCGEALCENFDGSFLCICPNDNEEFDPRTSQCRSMGNRVDMAYSTSLRVSFDLQERRECYYNLNDANFCDNVLSHNTTKQECCCTAGAGWGDNCEIHACPVQGSGTTRLCPYGSGLLPLPVSSVQSFGDEQRAYIDANECEIFGPDICKNGQCSNLFSTYTCYCRSGFFYDNIRLECVDYDECAFGNVCENGVCVNTAGSFNCFCSPPLVLDSTRRRCIDLNTTEEDDVHVDICWQQLEGDNMCAKPLSDRRTTYTECCCLHGVAWSEHCALCPRKDSADYAVMCNVRGSSDSLRERIGYEYERYEGFEGLRAEECGILNGCENGRCVRVREGYTCDCLDGYELDLDKMACIDINECEDISDKVPLCQNGECTNTEGSYKCTCLPGFVASAKPHKCIPAIPESRLREAGN
uniref:Latent-transforming growth factor beta-binding protein 2 n=1 Tax=Maylandia zebra TaxID=106582 RepID=A0A3P9BQ05_9CICH